MLIKIDYREKALIDCFTTTKDCPFEKANLLIGDIEIYDEVKQSAVAIVERKTVDDLASSIKDGRYSEQSFRLSASPAVIYYLIEGRINKMHQSLPKSTLLSAICSLSLKFKLLRSDCVVETADLLIALSHQLQKHEKTESPPVKYSSVIKTAKKDNIQPEIFGEIILCQIPGVSRKTATVIMDHYKTMSKFLEDTDKHGTLSTLTIQNRKISKTTITTIVQFLEKM